MAYVEINHLVKRFGEITAVHDVTFSVERGEVLGFLGPNGAGKSTTMKMITGFLSPDSGSITVGGDSIERAPLAVKKRLGYLPEGAPLYGDMTCAGLLEFIAEVRGFRGAQIRRVVDETIEKVNLGNVINQPIETLSKGFKRRVGLAQAILHDPEVLILDEPTDGLDPNQKHEVRTLIQSMAADKVIILSTHILEEVDAVCSRTVIIARGKVINDGTPGELEALDPRHNAVSVRMRTRGPREAVTTALSGLAGVARVEIETPEGDINDALQLTVYPEHGKPLAAEFSQLARAQGWEVESLHIERGRLDDVFRDLTLQGNQFVEGTR
ncbi:MAG: ABC-2 type transport system ATP-binding protein [Gammaproteobacteria bacterium]|jgi:ABC-2 type transport system ATP-binding protein